MNKYLLDTSILSVFAPERPPAPLTLQRWIVEQGAKNTLFTSTVVVLEIQRGISKLRRAGGTSRAGRLDQWLATLLADFADQTLAIDSKIGRLAGELEDSAISRGIRPGLADILIAATAAAFDLVVLTSNKRHFEVLNVKSINPLEGGFPPDNF